MLKPWPVVLVAVVCALSYSYGRWRRGHGSPITPRERIWFALLLPVVFLPPLVLPLILASDAMSPLDRVTAVLTLVGVGLAPLAIALCFAGALRLIRLY